MKLRHTHLAEHRFDSILRHNGYTRTIASQQHLQILYATAMYALVQGHAIGEGCPDSSPPAPETHEAGKKEHAQP